ncbi:MAG: hypothetical protein ACE1S7_01535 [Candidatus Tisiphia sp.]
MRDTWSTIFGGSGVGTLTLGKIFSSLGGLLIVVSKSLNKLV